MSLRSFTVFQDAVSSDAPQPRTTRSNAMVTRSSSLNLATSPNRATGLTDMVTMDKENFHPLTGERAGPSNNATKKRKTTVLAIKVQPSSASKAKKEKDAQPEQKKRKASTSTAAKVKTTIKKDGKVTGSARKGSGKRTVSRKVSPMPKVNEEEEAEKDRITQADIDSRCYELTVQPLADVSQAYDESLAFRGLPTTPEAKVKFCTVKASSAEPEIRDYFEPSQALFSSTSSRLRSVSEDVSEGRVFSTPERKQIYAAFTFSSPSATSARMSKASRSGSISPAELA
ncbi:hypothetical protein B0H34DRAFT_659075 [Crassisporium funariophilum]|nr:hypothetical protein B0H34DRAFT_659075 [Crassisporium funariophilum]